MPAPRPIAALAVALGALAACSAPVAQDGPMVTRLGPDSPRAISFASVTPYDFPEMIAGSAPPARVAAELVLPPGDAPVRGAAILSHGSGGPGGRQTRMADLLAEAGYAALVLDHFGPRGVTSTVRDQLRLTAQGMLADVMAARALLATHPRVPADRIGVIGWSKGAITATLGAVDRLAGYAGGAVADPSDRLAFAIAFYPFCGFDLAEERLASPLLMLLGGADDWTPAAPCEALAEAWAARDQPAEAVSYPGAPHGFDSGLLVAFGIDRAISVRDTSPGCTLGLAASGATVTLDGRHSLDSLEARQAFLADCGERGVTFGGDRAARDDAYARVLAFLERALP